ncbi:MAG TPA: phage tail protein [Bryobacteraceae bacterium]|nr:phage tail protein [Bryobacteraceae bacterium]
MGTINQIKQLAEADTPLLFFQCVLPSGDAQYWCTHSISFNGQRYAAKVLKHNLFDLQLSADDAMDGISQLSLTLANADSILSELNHEIKFKGSQLTVYFAFADLPSETITTESTVLFRGIAGDPDEITEDTLRLTFNNKLSLQRVAVPEVRVQRTCPWNFPTTLEQRTEAKDGGANGRYSRFYRCGYSADLVGGVGNLDNGQPFTSCDASRGQCTQRGMFDRDNSNNTTRRYGGFEFVPSAINVRTAGAKTSHLSPLLENSALYNDPVPVVYGTGWLKAPVIFARNDGNLTHMEVLMGLGTLQAPPQAPTVLKAVVNDVEIPQGVAGQDMTVTGWYSTVTVGSRKGNFSPDFKDANGTFLGDPYGSLAVLSVVVPNRICPGKSLPTVEVLLQGIGLDTYDANGALASVNGPVYTNNPAWVILDILRRCGWTLDELNVPSFAASAAYCGELITTTDLNGNTATMPRFQCNLILNTRQSAASLVRGIRVAASLMLRYGATGLLELVPESTLAKQQPVLPDGSNSSEMLDGGWPTYEFSDGTGPFSGIVRNVNGSSSVRMTSRSIAETSNRLSVEFQDEGNEYQQDSLSLVNSDDSALIGYEISSQSTALGIANFNQATRVLLRQLDKSTKGNQFIQFQTSFRALKVRPGDIIAVTYAKELMQRVPFRVVKLSPSVNYQTVTILAQIHDDDWYSDSTAVLAGAGRQPGSHVQTPRPLLGTVVNPDGTSDFGLQGEVQTLGDGTALQTITVSFAQPAKPNAKSAHLPLVSLSPEASSTAGGTLASGKTYYYAVSAVDSSGNEGAISFTVPISIPPGNNTATITGLSFPTPTDSFHVYRGSNPQLLYRIGTVKLAQANSTPTGYTYTDTGEASQPIGPPDSNFDHANFYYRGQYTPIYKVTAATSNTIASADMNSVPSAYANTPRVVRIAAGTGVGQERAVIANDTTSLTVSPAWSITPDETSSFAVVDSSWKFAAVSTTSPAQFQIPYQAGTTIQISGRCANVQNQEGSADLCPMTIWNVSGTTPDTGTPGVPVFTLTAPGGGNLTISQVGFQSFADTATVTSGAVRIFFWDEVSGLSTTLFSPVAAGDRSISLPAGITPSLSGVIQVGTELMIVGQLSNPATNSYGVDRTTLGTMPVAHNTNEVVRILQTTSVVLPFERGFFQNKASVNYLHTVSMPDCRVFAAQMSMTNVFGDGQTATNSYVDAPLRTLSGGQFSLQLGGYLATQSNAAPALLVQNTHAVRDIWASLGQAAQGYSIGVEILQNGVQYCSFVIPVQGSSSPTGSVDQTKPALYVDGSSLPPLQEGATLAMNVSLQSAGSQLSTGRDLTVTIRF